MSYRHDELDDDILDHPREREFTLSTGTVLGIFFGLALLCGSFFAFGYNMGSKARPAGPVSAEGPGPSANFNAFKPSPGAPAIQPVPGYLSQKEADAANKTAANTAYNTPEVTPATTSTTRVAPPPTQPPVRDLDTPPAAPVVRNTPPPIVRLPPPTSEPIAPGSFMVQVAAVSHAEDSELLIGALKRKGYSVAARTEPQDRLFHIQVGPFPNKKDAEAMRQRLLSDGYNAILK